MGFPLRTNIFASDRSVQREFARFPIQVMVLFSPGDFRFADAFRQLFRDLDLLTGGDVAFFAVLDPPADWVEVAAHRAWWRDYQRQIGTLGFTYDDTTLVREIARLFGVGWHHLPALAASTDLWTTECVITPTSPWHIERQLRWLTELVKEWGRPTIGHILETLRNDFGEQVRYHPADSGVRERMDRVYQVLNTYDPESRRPNPRFWRLATRETRTANRLIGNQLDRKNAKIESVQMNASRNMPLGMTVISTIRYLPMPLAILSLRQQLSRRQWSEMR